MYHLSKSSTFQIAMVAALVLVALGPTVSAQGTAPGECGDGDCGIIGDFVFIDPVGSGFQGKTPPVLIAKPPMSNATVFLYAVDGPNSSQGTIVQRARTSWNGHYRFDVAPGYYRVRVIPPVLRPEEGRYVPTAMDNVPGDDLRDSDIDANGFTPVFQVVQDSAYHAERWDAGFKTEIQDCSTKWTLRGVLWKSNDSNGMYNAGVDAPLHGVDVELWRRPVFGQLEPTYIRTTTGTSGTYEFRCVDPDSYFIAVSDSKGLGPLSQFYVSEPNPPHPSGTQFDNNCTNSSSEHSFVFGGLQDAGSFSSTSGVVDLLGEGGGVFETLDCGYKCQEQKADVLFVIDHSGSMSTVEGGVTRLAAAQTAANWLIDQLGQPRRAGLVAFSDEADVEVLLTDAHGQVKAAISSLVPTSATNIASALEAAQKMFSQRADHSVPGYVILLTDGRNSDEVKDDECRVIARQLHAMGIKMATIGLGAYEEVDVPLLTELASAPDLFFYSPGAQQLDALFRGLLPTICNPESFAVQCSSPGDLFVPLRGDYKLGGVTVWRVSGAHGAPGSGNNVNTVHIPDPLWKFKLTGIPWISHDPTAMSEHPEFYFERMFEIGGEVPKNIELRMYAWADDLIEWAELNGHRLSSTNNGDFHNTPASTTVTRDRTQFVVGDNRLVVKVSNSLGVKSALNVGGAIAGCKVLDSGGVSGCDSCPGEELGFGGTKGTPKFVWAKRPPLSWTIDYGSTPQGEQQSWSDAIHGGTSIWNDALAIDPFATQALPGSGAVDITHKVIADWNADLTASQQRAWRAVAFLGNMAGVPRGILGIALIEGTLCGPATQKCDETGELQLTRYRATKARVLYAYFLAPGWGILFPGGPKQCLPGVKSVGTLVTHELGHVIGVGHSPDNTKIMFRGIKQNICELSAEELATAICLMKKWSPSYMIHCTNPIALSYP